MCLQTRTDCKRCRYQACLKVKSDEENSSSPLKVGMLPELVDAGLRRRREEARAEMRREFSWRKSELQTTSTHQSSCLNNSVVNTNLPSASWQVLKNHLGLQLQRFRLCFIRVQMAVFTVYNCQLFLDLCRLTW